MKKIISILFLLVIYTQLKSQQQDLLNETWYLTKIVEDGIEYQTPDPLENFTYALLQFFPNENDSHDLSAGMCSHNVRMSVLSVNNEEFTCEYMDDTMAECSPNLPTYYHEFEGNYVGFWRSFPEGANSPFTYEITEENNMLALIVTNNKGDKTYYYNQEMSADDFSKKGIKYYPNPLKDKLIIENTDLKVTSVSIADISGKIIFSSNQFYSTKIEIDFKKFPKGVYFLTTELDDKTIKTEKILKK